MKFKIHRGTQEIGGTCVEVWTDKTRILLDFGLPLVEKDGSEFDFNKYKNLGTVQLIKEGILPHIEGLYKNQEKLIDGIIISHSHQDHYGLISYINENVQYHLGEATHRIIDINNLFTKQEIHLKNIYYFHKQKTFKIGDMAITPYWADHSAFDAYSFLIEANGKSLFYTGDFRGHGRKSKAFSWFTYNAPQNVDYLLLEGTAINRATKPFKTEQEIENELAGIFKKSNKINLVYTSGQNIDRLTSIYNACKRAGKILVVDVYVAHVLKVLSKFGKIPHPSKTFDNVKVIFPYFTSKRLKNEGNEKILYQFANYKITKDEISDQAGKIVMVVRPSMQKDLMHIKDIEGGNLIYSMWEGYLKKDTTKTFIDYLENRNFSTYKIHTSGHADTETIKKIVKAIKPKNIVPIHTFEGDKYKCIFKESVVMLKDGEVRVV